MELNGSAHLVGHLRLVGVEELAAAEELVDHHVLLGVLDARVEVEGGVLGRDSWAMTSTALIWLVVVVGGCRRWGLCDYVVDGCKRVSLRGA